MKSSKSIKIVIATIIALLFLSIFKSIRSFFLFIAYNSLILFDRLFLSIGTPIITYIILFSLFGVCYGVIVASKQLTLTKKIYGGGILGIMLIILLMLLISNPSKIGNLRNIKEESLFQEIKNTNSFELCNKYLERYSSSERASEVRQIQETALWDLALKTNSSNYWKRYIDMFDSREAEAQEKYEQAFWKEVLKANIEGEYRRYLAEFKSGKHRNAATSAINKIKRKQEAAIEVSSPQSNMQEEEQAQVTEEQQNKSSSNQQEQEKSIIPTQETAEVLAEHTLEQADSKLNKVEENALPVQGSIVKEERTIEKVTSRYGIINRGNGTTYSGMLKEGIPHGKGTEMFSDGSSLNGEWVDGKRHGIFVYKSPRGVRENQEFNNGRRIK